MPILAVLFDIDGTLVDSNEYHVMAWQEAFHEHGHRFELSDIRPQIGKGSDQLIPSLLPHGNADTRKALSQKHGAVFKSKYLELVKPFPHATDLIEMLHHRGKKIVLASSSAKAEVEHYVDLLGIESLLTGTITIDDVSSSKPSGDIFAAAFSMVFPLDASEVLAVGDTIYDVESALLSGIRTVAVRSGGVSGATLAEAGAPYIYSSVKELAENFEASPFAS